MKAIFAVLLLGVLSGCQQVQQPTYSSEPSIQWANEVDQACRESAAEVMVEAYKLGLDPEEAAMFSRINYLRCMDHFGRVI